MEKEGKSIGLEKKDAINRARWRVELERLLLEWVHGDKPGSKLD